MKGRPECVKRRATNKLEAHGVSMNRRWGIAVVVACPFILALCLWGYTHHKRTVVLKVETLPYQSTITELQRVIDAQRKTIEMYANRPKVVFRCLDDEPKLKYPRHASDDYTAVTMGTNNECGKTEELDAVVLIHSSAKNFDHRTKFRSVYSNQTVTRPYKLKVVFLIGQVEDASLQINLEVENRKFGDTVQGNFQDTYQNLTLKAVMGYRWVSETCNNFKLLVKMDDDVAFDVHRFFGDYWHRLRKDKKVHRIFCQVWKNAVVNREGKWKVEKGLFKNATYEFPYCSGFFVVVTADLVTPMYKSAKEFDFFWIDDVFLYGMVPHTIPTVGFTQLGARAALITQTTSVYDNCIKTKAKDCSYFAVVTKNSEQMMNVFNNFPHQLIMREKTAKSNTTVSTLTIKEPVLKVNANIQESGDEYKIINSNMTKSKDNSINGGSMVIDK